MNGTQIGGVSGGAIGGALTIFANYLIGVAWQLMLAHLPAVTPPSAEVLGAEQIIVTMLFAYWLSKEKLVIANGLAPAPAEPAKP